MGESWRHHAEIFDQTTSRHRFGIRVTSNSDVLLQREMKYYMNEFLRRARKMLRERGGLGAAVLDSVRSYTFSVMPQLN